MSSCSGGKKAAGPQDLCSLLEIRTEREETLKQMACSRAEDEVGRLNFEERRERKITHLLPWLVWPTIFQTMTVGVHDTKEWGDEKAVEKGFA